MSLFKHINGCDVCSEMMGDAMAGTAILIFIALIFWIAQ